MTYLVYGESEIGCARRSNQDAIAWALSDDCERFLAVLADGMGGHAGGDIARQTAVDPCMAKLRMLVKNAMLDKAEIIQTLNLAVGEANKQRRLVREKEASLSRMGTTLLIAYGVSDQVYIANVGDSRCYRLSANASTQITKDDTVAQAMVDDGSITKSEIPRVPFRNVLTKAVGTEPELCADIQRLSLNKNEALILCSDGLTGAVDAKQWPAMIAPSATVKQQVECLIDESINNKANDNVSVIIVRRQ